MEYESEPDKSLINETKRQITGSILALKATSNKIDDYNEDVKELLLLRTKLAARGLEKIINERNNK